MWNHALGRVSGVGEVGVWEADLEHASYGGL